MKTKIKDITAIAMMVLAGLLAVAGSTGCDQTYVPGIGYVNPWYTSAYYGVPRCLPTTIRPPRSRASPPIAVRQ